MAKHDQSSVAQDRQWRPRGILGWILTVVAVLLLVLFFLVAYFEIHLIDFLGWGRFGVNGFLFASQIIIVTVIAAAMGWWAWRLGELTAALLFLLTVVLTACLSVVPTISAYARAQQYRVPVSFREAMVPLMNGRYTAYDKTVVYWTTPEGQKLLLDVWRTSVVGNGPRPAVLKVHGGSWITGARSEQFRWNLLFNELGYEVFDMDYRLPRDIDPAKWVWTDEVGDVKCALRWIVANATKYNVDVNRIGIFGYSAGANLTALAAYTAGDPDFPSSCPGPDAPLKFVINVYLPSELAQMYKTTGSAFVQDSLKTYLGGPPSEVADRYKMASPVNYVSPQSPPTLLLHGLTDRVVPTEQSKIMDEALTNAGVVHEYYELPYADHGYDFNWNTFQTQISRDKVKAFVGAHG